MTHHPLLCRLTSPQSFANVTTMVLDRQDSGCDEVGEMDFALLNVADRAMSKSVPNLLDDDALALASNMPNAEPVRRKSEVRLPKRVRRLFGSMRSSVSAAVAGAGATQQQHDFEYTVSFHIPVS